MAMTGRYTVLARYPDLQSARKAIDALQNRGIDEKDIDVRGPGVLRAEQAADHEVVTAPRDKRIFTHVVMRAFAWAAVGAAIGAAAGAVLATIDFGPFEEAGFPALILSCAIAGAAAFGLPAYFSAISQGKGWELSFEPEIDGEVVVSLRSGDEELARKAEGILRDADGGHIRKRQV